MLIIKLTNHLQIAKHEVETTPLAPGAQRRERVQRSLVGQIRAIACCHHKST